MSFHFHSDDFSQWPNCYSKYLYQPRISIMDHPQFLNGTFLFWGTVGKSVAGPWTQHILSWTSQTSQTLAGNTGSRWLLHLWSGLTVAGWPYQSAYSKTMGLVVRPLAVPPVFLMLKLITSCSWRSGQQIKFKPRGSAEVQLTLGAI